MLNKNNDLSWELWVGRLYALYIDDLGSKPGTPSGPPNPTIRDPCTYSQK